MKIVYGCQKSECAIRSEIASTGVYGVSPYWFVTVDVDGDDLLQYVDWNRSVGGSVRERFTPTINHAFETQPTAVEVVDAAREYGLGSLEMIQL